MKKWWNDFKWALRMMRVKRMRDKMIFSKRARFDSLIRPRITTLSMNMFTGEYYDVVAYPDAFYTISNSDIRRGKEELMRGYAKE